MAAMMELKSLFVSIPALWRLTSGRQTPSQAVKPMVSSANASPEAIRRQLLPIGSAVVPPPAAVATEPNRPIRKYLILLKNFGAGEGIRTLDPNLGKVACGLLWSTPPYPASLRLPRNTIACYDTPREGALRLSPTVDTMWTPFSRCHQSSRSPSWARAVGYC